MVSKKIGSLKKKMKKTKQEKEKKTKTKKKHNIGAGDPCKFRVATNLKVIG